MKKFTFLKKCFLLLLIANTLNVMAQPMTGAYTIDNSQPSSATNFTTFVSFANYLNANGVSGPVTVNVLGGNIYTEQVSFSQAANISATNSVTINGNGRTLRFNATSTAARHTLILNGADYMTFIDLIVEGTHGTNALACHLWNNANYNQFFGCTFVVPMTSTSTYCVPWSISGSGVAAIGTGNNGSFNVVNTCTMIGGYYNTVIYGSTGTNYADGNQILNSYCEDFYTYGIYNVYAQNTKIIGNIVQRENRTSVSTGYGIMCSTGSVAMTIEGNHVRRLFHGTTSSSSTSYCIYVSVASTQQDPHIIRNNIVSDIRTNGTIGALYLPSCSYAIVEHNTISLDDATSTAATTYGAYLSGSNVTFRNNIISIERGGTSSSNRTAVFIASAAALTNFAAYNNVYHVAGATLGNDWIGYIAGGALYVATLQTWQTETNEDWTSMVANPSFNNPANNDYQPTSVAINNLGSPVGVAIDFFGNGRDMAMPDPGAIEFFTSACSAAPNAGTFGVPSMSICAGQTVQLDMAASSFTHSGYSVQWYASTISSVGGYSAIPGATLAAHPTAPINSNTWYQVAVTCTLTTLGSTSTPGPLLVAPPSSSTVPYHEDFEAISPNDLPNCSWASTIPSVWPNQPTYDYVASNNRVPRNGSGYAVFPASQAGTQYFYTNEIWLNTGVTYSASMWYITDGPGYDDWSDLSILVGTSQSAAGMQTVASISPVTGLLYQPLSNTFSVAASGYYYVAVRANGGTGVAPYLSWDDLEITIPCSHNSPAMYVTTTSDTVCAGKPVNLIAYGADSYSWNVGSTNASLVQYPLQGTSYQVVGTNTLSGCSSTLTQIISVQQSPQVLAAADNPETCEGEEVTLTAVGDGSYNYIWAHGPSGAVVKHSPNTTTTYSVTGINSFGCHADATVEVTVHPAPMVTAAASSTDACAGDALTLSGGGAINYQWTSVNDSTIYLGNPVIIYPTASGQYILSGTDANGCAGTDMIVVGVNECTGLAENGSAEKFRIFPNPTAGSFVVETAGTGVVTISVKDVTGRTMMEKESGESRTKMDISNLAAGIYHVCVIADGKTEVIKLIKQ